MNGTPSPKAAFARPEWNAARRHVIKIGSALLTEKATGTLKQDWLASLVSDAAALRNAGKDVILVSSGAIALGRGLLGLPKGPLKLEEAQASAAVGQIALAEAYRTAFASHRITAAQILVTPGDTEERRRYLNARSTIETLLKLGAIPVVNENDTVATAEIRYGDNDRLAARVATMMTADVLVLLSDIDGLYTAPPHQDPTATRLEAVTAITPEIEAMAGDAGSELSRGGMVTKVMAAKIATGAGTHMVIASGKEAHPIRRLADGGACTWFIAQGTPVTARKRWIGGALEPRGTLVVDDGARAALMQTKSLLPSGIVSVSGQFDRGDAVVIRDRNGVEIGRGLASYTAVETAQIAGRNTAEIAAILGYSRRNAVVHRDDLVIHG